MGTTPAQRRRALAKVLDEMPITIRTLARSAGVTHSFLVRSRDGDRALTDHVGHRVVRALRANARTLNRLADHLEARL